MNKFEIGDLVKIGNVKGSLYSKDKMRNFEGRVGRIIERHPDAEKYPQLVKIEDTDHWWFDENILTPFSEEALAIEKEIDVLKETVVALEKQKNDIISHINDQKSRISRLEKKLNTLS